MNKNIKISVYILLLSLIGCSNQNNNRLIVDELFISKHQVGLQGSDTMYYFDGKTFRFHSVVEPCKRGIKIFKSSYYPELIISIKSSGELNGFLRNCPKVGYFNITLSDSLMIYFNKQIEKINFEKLDTLYSGYGEGFTEYFISITKGKEVKQIMIMQDYEGTKIFRKFIDSIYSYANRLELKPLVNIPFRKDSLIVLKSEKYWEMNLNKSLEYNK
jgi:hypothetical protein